MERLIQPANSLAKRLRVNAKGLAKGFFKGLTLILKGPAKAKTCHTVAPIRAKRNSLQTLPNGTWYTLGRVLKNTLPRGYQISLGRVLFQLYHNLIPYQITYPTKSILVGLIFNDISMIDPTKFSLSLKGERGPLPLSHRFRDAKNKLVFKKK